MAAPSALWVEGVKPEICLHFERRKEAGGGEEKERRGIPGSRGKKEQWEGAVAIRKGSQKTQGSANHGTPIYNAYQVFFIEGVGVQRK